MTLAIVVAASALAAANVPVPEGGFPVQITGPWTIEIGPGKADTPAGVRELSRGVPLNIAPVEMVQVRAEEHKPLPVFNPNTGNWRRGDKLRQLIAEECTGTGLVVPPSIRITLEPNGAEALAKDTDYIVDAFWAQIGRIEGGGIGPEQAVYVDYDYYPTRLDSIFVDASGNVRVAPGEPGIGNIYPPEPGPGEAAVCTIWHNGIMDGLQPENVFPIEFAAKQAAAQTVSAAEQFLPKTLAKLRNGEPVTIVAWGDSVTNGGGVKAGKQDLWYQQQFVTRLRARFSQSEITLHTASWPGGNSGGYMSAPAGGQYDFKRDVLDKKPDLVTIEFVNDAYLEGDALKEHYGKIRDALRAIPAEIILITPHYVRQDWMGVSTVKVDEDPRPYVRGLRVFAADNGIAVADAAKLWGELWRKGIPYPVILANAINHPDERGHEMFADALMAVFPEK
ncbi:MAG TPA: GDSL-type esterase/lipase family protein [Candidatus Hydrogenedentes bacterium]|nr:GDSL-type esterase/lipase family protein [Candidatus Hydrogenedentota bacterium]HQM47140.1 GDSL-type esterase/lipase family protein [Candidatus Hydrogenedentota bacterium]